MKLRNDKYEIDISKDITYTLQSADNKHYDYEFNPSNLTKNDFIKTFDIQVNEINNHNSAINIALIGSLFCSTEHCSILMNTALIVLMNNVITQIDLETKSIIGIKDIGSYGCFFEIYQVDGGYIIYGELEILKLDYALNIEWDFSGSDIFVTQDNCPAFIITNEYIQLCDWNGIIYKLDLAGKLIYDTYRK